MQRATSFATLIAAAFAFALPAFADLKAETYVQANASEVLSSLNNPKLTPTERTAAFSTYMDKFTDLNTVSNFVIGKYSKRFTEDELKRYRIAFRRYALAVYEAELDAYRGEAVVVKGSNDIPRKADKTTDYLVSTVIKRKDGKETDVLWQVITRQGKYTVVDVGLKMDGNLIWLAQSQRKQFVSILGQNNGSADVLIKRIEAMTADLEAKSAKRNKARK